MAGSDVIIGLQGQPVALANCTVALCSLDYAQIRYIPNKGVNLAYLAIFALFLAINLGQGVMYKTWGFTVGMICGLLLEIIGYVGRLMLHNNPFDFNSFVIYLVCLTIAPAFITASIYLCLSRLVIVYGQETAPFKPRTYTLTFIVCDLISLVLQALGGALAATADTHAAADIGVHLMIAGLIFQVVSLTLFVAASLQLAIRIKRAAKSARSPDFAHLAALKRFKYFPIGLALAVLFIYVRCMFRVAELWNGFNSVLANNEPAFNGLEAPMVILAVISLTVLHPGYCFAGAWRAAVWKFRSGRKTQQTGSTFTSSGDLTVNESKETSGV